MDPSSRALSLQTTKGPVTVARVMAIGTETVPYTGAGTVFIAREKRKQQPLGLTSTLAVWQWPAGPTEGMRRPSRPAGEFSLGTVCVYAPVIGRSQGGY